ncbi:hypothetical protein Aerorivi_02520 [Aeromonas rivipollensis]|uniref:hypothetical protein n=1 Tax=Aeromonas rivipollensis TaxID=948519 RepID=UPI0038D24B8A
MTPDEVSLWTMYGTWFAALATTSAVITSLWLASYTRKAKLTLELRISNYDSATLRIINQSSVIATVDSITLSTSKRTEILINKNDDLVKNPLMPKKHDEYINENSINPSGHYKEFEIDFLSLKRSYDKFLPYDNDGYLTRVIEMPPAYILVKIVGGQVFHTKLPPIFFDRYKNDDCFRLEVALKQATESPELYLRFTNEDERNQKQLQRLDWYMKSKRNSLFLIG